MKYQKLLFYAFIATLLSTSAPAATVQVQATASGQFGQKPKTCTTCTRLVKTISVKAAGTITIRYLSGTWCTLFSSVCTGPNGVFWNNPRSDISTPLQEAVGVVGTNSSNLMALMGAFVPAAMESNPSFVAIDMTRRNGGYGIMPNQLFFVGSYNVIQVNGPGTLYLGVNDMDTDDNSGFLKVEVTSP